MKTETTHTPIPVKMEIVDQVKAKGMIAQTRFAITAETDIPNLRAIIAQLPYRPHAELFIRAVNAHQLLVEVAKEVIAEAKDCSCEGYKCLFCFAQEAIAAAEAR